jgi:hypothetical protein
MPTKTAAPPTDAPRAKQLRLTLTEKQWRALRIRAAEEDTSMQAFVAAVVRRELGDA